MNLPEFRAWLDGYGASINGAPTPDQWAIIKGKLATVQAITPMSPVPSIGTLTPFPRYDTTNFPPPKLGTVTCGGDLPGFESLTPGDGSY